jgi:hypothetical protein
MSFLPKRALRWQLLEGNDKSLAVVESFLAAFVAAIPWISSTFLCATARISSVEHTILRGASLSTLMRMNCSTKSRSALEARFPVENTANFKLGTLSRRHALKSATLN